KRSTGEVITGHWTLGYTVPGSIHDVQFVTCGESAGFGKLHVHSIAATLVVVVPGCAVKRGVQLRIRIRSRTDYGRTHLRVIRLALFLDIALGVRDRSNIEHAIAGWGPHFPRIDAYCINLAGLALARIEIEDCAIGPCRFVDNTGNTGN